MTKLPEPPRFKAMQLDVTMRAKKPQFAGWYQYHVAQAIVEYQNRHPELGVFDVSTLALDTDFNR